MKTILYMSLILTLGISNLSPAKSKSARHLDCKGDEIILPECQMDDIRGQIEGNPLFKEAKAESLRRLEIQSDSDSPTYVTKPHCNQAKTAFYEKPGSGVQTLRTQFKCEATIAYDVYQQPKPTIVKRSVFVSIESTLENEFEWYIARIEGISFTDQSKY